MKKGFYTQAVCMLVDGQIDITKVRNALAAAGFDVVKETPSSENWWLGGPSLVISYKPEVNGCIAVDTVAHRWPDSMGDPHSDPLVFAAWSMGNFGPFAFPGGLERSQQQAWAWPAAKIAPNSHHSFIRIRASYVFGAGNDLRLLPAEYDPLDELNFLSRIALALFPMRGMICYFNPNGEVLLDRGSFNDIWDACANVKKAPLPLWVNIRLFNLSDQFLMMDTVGNAQLDIPDIEAIFPRASYNLPRVDQYLRDVTLFLLERQAQIRSGDAIDGPGENNLSWNAEWHDDGTAQPPRDVLRLYPQANREGVAKALSAATDAKN